ncbi:MAG: hypothetical protein IRZ07_13050 [Microbispora sp.]|nr:hypothetical protein [Microbispora sp.]
MEEEIWRLEGRFRFGDLLTQLLRTDAFAEEIPHPREDLIRALFLPSVRAGIPSRMDLFPLVELPDPLPPHTEARIFHERTHYWQYLASPLLQQRFFLELEKIAIGVARAGGDREQILASRPPEDPAGVFRLMVATEADCSWFDLRDTHLLGGQQVDFPLGTFQVLYARPNDLGVTYGYGAALELPDGQTALVPFTALALAESASQVAECASSGKPPPRLERNTPGEVRYYGCWEYWRRLHGGRVRNERALVAGFLAAVDLALTGGYPAADERDPEMIRELRSIPYRFGKLAFRAQAFEFPEVDEADPGEAVERFQRDMCAWAAWPEPKTTFARSAVMLTKLLAVGLGRRPLLEYGLPEDDYGRLWVSDESNLAGELDALAPVWRAISVAALADRPRPVGFEMAGMMLNAMHHRIRHPGRFAVPHLYRAELTEEFPLPLLLLDGIYCVDRALENQETVFRNRPYVGNALKVAKDTMQLVPLLPLADGADRCGFYDAPMMRATCLYGRAGLGCPKAGLTEAQRRTRLEHEIGDWCHWEFAARKTGIRR